MFDGFKGQNNKWLEPYKDGVSLSSIALCGGINR